AGSPHLAKEVALVHGEFRRGLVPRESLLALAEEDPLQADLALCFAEYERTLAEAGWYEEEDLLALALRSIEEGWRPPMRSLLVHGFTDFTPLQAAVLRGLARSAAVTVLLPEFEDFPGLAELRRDLRGQFPDWELAHSPPAIEGRTRLERLVLGGGVPGFDDESVQELVGEGPAALASLIARVARARLGADPSLLPGEIAVVRREGLPSDGLSEALRRHGLPVEEEEGPPLLSLNGVGAILAALDCLARDWPRTSVLRLARGVFVGEEAHLAEVLARASAEAKVVRTKAAWMRLSSSDACAEDPVGTALSRLERGLALLPEEGTAADYLRALRAFTAFWQVPARYWPRHQDERALAAYAREMRGLERLFGLLEEMAAAEGAAGEARRWDLPSFAAELLRLAGENHSPEASGLGGGVRCLGPSEIRGLRFRLVFLVGLNEGEFPKPISEDWLLPDEKRLRLRGAFHGLELRRTLAAREWQLLANVLSAAGETLYLCRAEVDARGEETVPSVFFSFLRDRLGALPVRRLGAGDLLPAELGEAWDESAMKARLMADLLW
ncbi:MAG: hypothetical protein K6U03_10480, partial [Firmicutes bacterium]|nr:hypothetical protein [Bacillota bacterium]